MAISRVSLRTFVIGAALVAASPRSQAQNIQDFFDGSELHDIRLTMSPGDWTLLHEHYSDKKTNYQATFEWRNITIPSVGIHTRGTGSLNPRKPGLAIEFAKYDGAQRFLGLSAVYLRNFVEDPSGLHERLAMQLYARMGLPYQRAAHARLFVNGEYAGIYQTLEPLDDRFLLTRFGTAEGNLYEGVGGKDFHLQYLGDDPALYVPALFELKNQAPGATEAAERIAAMIKAINSAKDEEFMAEVGQYLDLDAFVTFVAVETALGECDGILSVGGMSNYYLYRRPGDDRFYFLVWDKEMTFTSAVFDVWGAASQNVLLRRALDQPVLKRRFMETLSQAATLMGSTGGWLAQEIERQSAQIRDAVRSDPSYTCLVNGSLGACNPASFDDGVQYLRWFARERSQFLLETILQGGWTEDYLAPYLAPGEVTNAASQVGLLAPREIASARVRTAAAVEVRPSQWPLPLEFAGVTVRLAGGRPAPIVMVSPTEVWFQLPPDLLTGPGSLYVTVNGRASQSIPVEIRPANPGVLSVMHVDGRVVSNNAPALPGSMLIAWSTGLGSTYSDLEIEAPEGVSFTTEMCRPVSVLVGGLAAPVFWSGLAPGSVLQMVLFQVPAGVPRGSAVPLVMSVLGEPGGVHPLITKEVSQ